MVIGKIWLGDRYLAWFDEDGIGEMSQEFDSIDELFQDLERLS